jgi:hypothetical protein
MLETVTNAKKNWRERGDYKQDELAKTCNTYGEIRNTHKVYIRKYRRQTTLTTQVLTVGS